MKILHLCLANFYIDNYSYQENILTKYHKKLGYDVEIIASLVSFDENGKSCLLSNGGHYVNEHGIPVTRLKYRKILGSKKLRKYRGTYQAISNANPDIIFIHGLQFLDISNVVDYVKRYPEVRIYIDNHADFVNSATNWISKNILHKIIWKRCADIIEPFTNKFYGVLPARVDFLENVYKVPQDKTELLVMGADDEKVNEAKRMVVREKIREKYNIKKEDFLLITGGKINKTKKQTLLLMEAVKELKEKNVKLIVFGTVIEELKEDVQRLTDGEKIQFIGWIQGEESYKYFSAADLGVFPGSHSVLWEQAVGTGLPCIFKYWKGTTHVDVGGNCLFLYHDTVEEIKNNLKYVINQNGVYKTMQKAATNNGLGVFSYLNIAKKSIEIN